MQMFQIVLSGSLRLFLPLVLLASASFAVTFNFNDFSSTPALNLVGVAAPVGPALRLSPSSPSTAGAAWLSNLVDVQSGFTTLFTFKITDQFAYRGDLSIADAAHGADGGDGITFVVQNASNTAIGLPNGGLGYMGIPNSLAVVYDTWRNIPYCEPDNNHVSVQSLGVNPNSPVQCTGPNSNANPANANLGTASPSINFSDGGTYTAKIVYTPGSLKVYLVDLDAPLMDVAVNLGSLLNLQGGNKAYIGLTSATGGAWENHDLVNWSFSNVPEPSTLSVAGIGLALLFVSRFKRP